MSDQSQIRVQLFSQYSLTDRGQKVLVYAGGNNDEEPFVEVAKSEDLEMETLPENAYQEVIIDRNFTSKELLQPDEVIDIDSGVRLLFTVHKNKPATGTAIDVCKLTKCKPDL